MRKPLAAPFALLGAAGGWLTADALALSEQGEEEWIRFLLVAVTPVVAWFVGRVIAPEKRAAALRFPLCVIAGGVINGLLIGTGAMSPVAAIVGALFGGFVAATWIPFLAPACGAAIASKARAPSLLARAEARDVWAGACVAITVGALVPRGMNHGSAGALAHVGDAALAIAAAVATIAIATMDAIDLARVRRLAALPKAPRSGRATDGAIDFGVGDEAWEDAAPELITYRDAARVPVAYVGDGARAARALAARAIASSLGAALATAAAIASALPPAR